MGLIARLGKLLGDNRLVDKRKRLTKPLFLIIDEIGDVPIDRQNASCCSSTFHVAMNKAPSFW
jgi:DNA replication protein DnaC